MAGVVAAKMKAKKQKEEEEEAKVNNELPDSQFTHSTENISLEEREICMHDTEYKQVKDHSFSWSTTYNVHDDL